MLRNYANQKVHRLTFLRPSDERRHRKILWEAVCECGKEVVVLPYDVTHGHTRSCGCYFKETASERGKRYGGLARIYEPRISSARRYWKQVYGDASFETFLRLSQENCDYCNCAPAQVYNAANNRKDHTPSHLQVSQGDFIFNGLDRVDNSRGHTDDNVVPCCQVCNAMKSDLPRSLFLEKVKLIAAHAARG